MEKMTDKFLIVTEGGKKYLIYEYTDMIDITTIESKGKEYRPGLKNYRTEQGMAVYRLKQDSYQIVQLNITGKKV